MGKVPEELEVGKYEIPSESEYSWQDAFARALALCKHKRPVILCGPPGTGKTLMVEQILKGLASGGDLGNSEIVQFHPKYNYEDFIEGFFPSESGGFIKRDGVFKQFCNNIQKGKVNVFVIDEMNRAELSTTLGETLYLIENRKNRKVKTAHFGDDFQIPEEVAIIGTMNTADRNIAVMDFALRRRFSFVSIYPDVKELTAWLNSIGFAFKDFSIDSYIKLFAQINARISGSPLMGPHMQLGHALMVPSDSLKSIGPESITFNLEEVVLPQLEAYCGYGNSAELSKIVTQDIANKFVKRSKLNFTDIINLVRDAENEYNRKNPVKS